MAHLFICILISLLLPVSLYAQDTTTAASTQETIATLAQRSRSAQARAHFQQAKKLEQLNKEVVALQELDRAITLKHDFEEALLLRAQIKRRLDDYPGALSDYQALLFLTPENTEARFERAQLLYYLQRYEAALTDFIYLLENDLGETNTVYFRGGDQTVNGTQTFVVESATTLQSGIQADIWNMMGLCYLELGEFTKAATHFELALSVNASNPNLHSNLGLTAERSGDTLQAIGHYRHALELQPNHPVALQNFSYLTRKINRLDLAEDAFQAISPTEEASPMSLLHQGMLYHQQGKYRQAIHLFDRAIAQQPREADFYVQRGFSHEKLNQFDRALKDYTQALSLNPRLEKAYLNRGNVYYKQRKLDLALQDYYQAQELNPDNAKVYYNIGLVHHRLDQFADACDNLERAMKLGYQAARSVIEEICKNP